MAARSLTQGPRSARERHLAREARQLRFEPLAQALALGRIGSRCHAQGIPKGEHTSAERKGDQKVVPGAQVFFLLHPKATGMIGSLESRASSITPACTRCRGPRGPSGVMATS